MTQKISNYNEFFELYYNQSVHKKNQWFVYYNIYVYYSYYYIKIRFRDKMSTNLLVNALLECVK